MARCFIVASRSNLSETCHVVPRLSIVTGRYLNAVNMSAINKGLFEDKCFGYARDACTHAVRAKKRLMAQAMGGAFFLDEITERDLSPQAKLLRVIEERELYRIKCLRL